MGLKLAVLPVAQRLKRAITSFNSRMSIKQPGVKIGGGVS